MNEKKVFIIADIGLDKKGDIHVGDEAMFFANVMRYVKLGYTVSASSRSKSDTGGLYVEYLDAYITGPLKLARYIFCALMYRFFKVNIFPLFFRPTIKALTESALVHVSGGGNLTSFWPGHIYYRAFMILLARMYGLPVIVTSQTVGPITHWFHGFVLRVTLNRVDCIGVRDRAYSTEVLKRHAIVSPEIRYMPDDALCFDRQDVPPASVSQREIRVGLCLHEWGSDTEYLAELLRQLHNRMGDVYYYIIPHHFGLRAGIDDEFMMQLTKHINPERVIPCSFAHLIAKSKVSVCHAIRERIADMDIVLSTRYHGIIFALDSAVPAFGLNYDTYYETKNRGAFELFCIDPDRFTLNLGHPFHMSHVVSKIAGIYTHRVAISKEIGAGRSELHRRFFDFHSTLIQKYSL